MAVNERSDLPNQSAFYAAMSGGGKSQAVRQAKKGRRVIAWDPDRDHPVKTRVTSIRALVEFLRVHGKGAAFSVAYSGDNTPEAFELFCAAVWAVLDGTKRTDIIIEELADVSRSTGKAGKWAGQLIRRGRKYHGVMHAVTQRPQEVPKTIFSQCAYKWIGQQDGEVDTIAMSKRADVSPEQIKALEPLQFWVKAPAEPAELVTLKYKK